MKLSRQDIADFLKLFVFGVGSRALAFLTVFLLARHISIDHFAWWQLGRAAANYVLIVMEAGFFFHIALLIQKDGFSIASVRTQIYIHRLRLGLFSLPFFFLYLGLTDVPLWYATLFVPLFAISIADYDSLAVGAGRSVATGYARFLKNGLALGVVAAGAFYSFASLPVLATTIGAAASAIYLHRSVARVETFNQGKKYTASLWGSLRDSRHFSVMQFTQTLMQSAALLIAGIFVSNSGVAHYGVALLVAEFALFPAYIAQRVIQAKYINNPRSYSAILISCVGSILMLFFLTLHYFYFQVMYRYLFPTFDQVTLHSLVNVLLIYVTVRIPNTFIQLHLNSTAREHYVSIAAVTGMVINVSLNFVVIPLYGVNAAPWVTVAAELTILFFLIYSSKRVRREYGEI